MSSQNEYLIAWLAPSSSMGLIITHHSALITQHPAPLQDLIVPHTLWPCTHWPSSSTLHRGKKMWAFSHFISLGRRKNERKRRENKNARWRWRLIENTWQKIRSLRWAVHRTHESNTDISHNHDMCICKSISFFAGCWTEDKTVANPKNRTLLPRNICDCSMLMHNCKDQVGFVW